MSDALKHLQNLIGAKPDGAFGPKTARAIQAHYNLTKEEGAHVLGQAHHESAGFEVTEEKLSYTAPRLMKVWPTRFKTKEDTAGYARNPKALANKVYADRMGNGDEASGEGFLYRGRGFIQLTGKTNYHRFSVYMNRPELMKDPSPVSLEFAFQSALWFFISNELLPYARSEMTVDMIKHLTKRINGGTHGLKDRTAQTRKIYTWLD